MWQKIWDYLLAEYSIFRSINSLQSKWRTLQHDSQCYIAVRTHITGKLAPEHTQKGVLAMVMELHCQKTNERTVLGVSARLLCPSELQLF